MKASDVLAGVSGNCFGPDCGQYTGSGDCQCPVPPCFLPRWIWYARMARKPDTLRNGQELLCYGEQVGGKRLAEDPAPPYPSVHPSEMRAGIGY